MKPITAIVVGVAALLGAASVGYWLGTDANPPGVMTDKANPPERKVLYYRNPMGLPDTSPVPKKDSMDMDYIPVYADEADGETDSTGQQVKISVEKVQKLGVKTAAATLRQLSHTVRAVGRIEPNERRIYTITPKFEGWIEALHVNALGDVVKAGQPLFEVYSPDLIAAQREYLVATQGSAALHNATPQAQNSMQTLSQASLMRLTSWGLGEQELQQLRNTGEVKRTLVYRSPALGVVLEKPALQGMRFMPGEMMYKIADLSTVWVMADVFEQDIALIKTGQPAVLRLDAFPGREFKTRVAYIYPTLNEQTRTIPVRLELANKEGLLKPGMYAQVELQTTADKISTVTVPDSAVIYSGQRTIILVELGEGRYEVRDVKLGRRSDDDIEVLEGIAENEKVVVSANFLIDAESNLKAVIGGFSASPNGAPKPDLVAPERAQ